MAVRQRVGEEASKASFGETVSAVARERRRARRSVRPRSWWRLRPSPSMPSCARAERAPGRRRARGGNPRGQQGRGDAGPRACTTKRASAPGRGTEPEHKADAPGGGGLRVLARSGGGGARDAGGARGREAMPAPGALHLAAAGGGNEAESVSEARSRRSAGRSGGRRSGRSGFHARRLGQRLCRELVRAFGFCSMG